MARRWGKALLWGVLASLGALLLLEGAARLLWPELDPSGQVVFTAQGGLPLGPPGASLRQTKTAGDFDVPVQFNALGLRDDKDLRQARPEDWFVVGDSFAWGWGVQEHERFSNVLQQRLARPVYNLSTPTDLDGYARLVAYAQAQGAPVRRVILTLCMENDVRDYGKPAPSAAAASPWLAALRSRSVLLAVVTVAAHRQAGLQAAAQQLGLLIPNLEGIAPTADDSLSVASTADATAALLRDREAVVLLVPSRALWVGPDSVRARAAAAHRSLVQALLARGLRVVDPRAAFEADGNPLGRHFAHDPHWTAATHAQVAELLRSALSGPP